MSNVKERILGAVTIMSEKDAEKVWELIQGTFCLSNAEEDIPVLQAWRKDPAHWTGK